MLIVGNRYLSVVWCVILFVLCVNLEIIVIFNCLNEGKR